MGHVPVLLPEVVELLRPADNEIYVDGTFGAGGYSLRILDAGACLVFGIDRDPDAISRGQELVASRSRLTLVRGRFGDLETLLRQNGIRRVHGIILDIGVSSFQLSCCERGFSFMHDGPLDMRMDQTGMSAADVVNRLEEADLAGILRNFGQEKQARRIARSICMRRTQKPFTTTLDLAATIERAVGGRRGRKIHPATLSFQALRIYVNDELNELARCLEAAERVLSPGGRLVVVTFHSLEDRLVKHFFRDRSGRSAGGSRYRPPLPNLPRATFKPLTGRAVRPGVEEIKRNPRARSARLRAGVRTDSPVMVLSGSGPGSGFVRMLGAVA